jgi:hypothetical protein
MNSASTVMVEDKAKSTPCHRVSGLCRSHTRKKERPVRQVEIRANQKFDRSFGLVNFTTGKCVPPPLNIRAHNYQMRRGFNNRRGNSRITGKRMYGPPPFCKRKMRKTDLVCANVSGLCWSSDLLA